MSEWRIPAARVSTGLEIKKSRFIGVLAPAESRAEAMALLETLRGEYPDARHHCWGFVIGEPGNASEAGMSDDGEPGGTAGKPILGVLEQNRIGNAMLVVVRYFGGVKLGAGGLVRAYSGAAGDVVRAAELRPNVPMTSLSLEVPFEFESLSRRLAGAHEASIESVVYGQLVRIELNLPRSRVGALTSVLKRQSSGRIRMRHSAE